jgi:hypothetical protein
MTDDKARLLMSLLSNIEFLFPQDRKWGPFKTAHWGLVVMVRLSQ